MRQRPAVVLVDAYTSGRYLAPEFAALGAQVVHVQSTREFIPSMPAPDLSCYAANIIHTDLDTTVRALAGYRPVCVLPGQEPGVLLADALAERLGTPSNGTASSPARRDKYTMIARLRHAGLYGPDQHVHADPEVLVDWADSGPGYPVVAKPRRSAAGDSVYVCETADELRSAAKAVLTAETIYGEPNHDVLVQSYLRGAEYVVDMVTYEGRRYVCGVWEYRKRLLPSGRNIYDREYLLSPDEAPAATLIGYVRAVLDALDIRYGPTHAEVILTSDGPALVEVGARIAGNMHPGFHDRCAGANQATVTALAYLDPERFHDRYGERVYTRLADAMCVTTSTELSGTVTALDTDAVRAIETLPTVYGLDLKIEPGGALRPTVDLYSSTMRIFLRGPSRAAIERDYQRIKELKDSVYRIRPAGSDMSERKAWETNP